MVVTISSRIGPVPYEIDGEPFVVGHGEGYACINLRNTRTGRSDATIRLSLQEVQQIAELLKRRK